MLQKSFLGQTPLGFHHIAYTEWGTASDKPPVICVHGLTRNGRDFDRLASALQKNGHVFCPDMIGRGKSDWVKDASLYNYPQYMSDMTAMIARVGSATVDWVGTSMGGILGMFLAAQPNSPIRRIVVNDVGPFIGKDALIRIGNYVGLTPEFADLPRAERFMREQYASFGITDDEDWHEMAKHGTRVLANGKLTEGYDPAIASIFKSVDKDVDFWNVYDRIQCPMLLIRGANSDILSSATAQEMMARGPKPDLAVIPDVGHAPALMDLTQIQIIEKFLAA